MKSTFLCLICGFAFCFPLRTKQLPDNAPKFSAPAASVSDTISFAGQIQPILKNRCMPCHFPGGKMYEKMPFDQGKTLVDHAEGIVKRFKEANESKLLQEYITASRH